VDNREAEEVFFNQPLLLTPDELHSGDEVRWRALGRTDADRKLTVIFTLRKSGALIRVISARNMHRKEEAQYDQEA
ncbi:MAG: BrnT family toxin, partial [Gammaproteobacteria bacterium]